MNKLNLHLSWSKVLILLSEFDNQAYCYHNGPVYLSICKNIHVNSTE